jgi:hypothetical protein
VLILYTDITFMNVFLTWVARTASAA